MRLRIEAENAVVDVVGERLAEPAGTADRVIAIPGGTLLPGLINAHEHLWLNHFGRLGNGPYANAYDWARDIHDRCRDIIADGRSVPRRTALLIGAWKNLLCGATTVVHHDTWEPDFEHGFPIRVPRIPFAHSLGLSPSVTRSGCGPFAMHVAEGTDRAAAEEIWALAVRRLLDRQLVAIHAVGPDEDGIARLRQSGCTLVWCPTSNDFLLGRTMPCALMAEGADVLVGTDSLLTGEGDLLDELRAARHRGLSDQRLIAAVGVLAAERLGLEMPSLTAGSRADVIILRRPLLEATSADVALVMTAGRLRVLDPSLLPSAAVADGQIVAYKGTRRWVSESASLPRLWHADR